MTEDNWQAAAFDRHRAYPDAVAYRMLGSMTEEGDAAWLRLSHSSETEIRDMRAWLTTVVGRVCVDTRRARRARRQDVAGVRAPEPVVGDEHAPGPAQETVLADSVGLALVGVLERLSPRGRLAFVLLDMSRHVRRAVRCHSGGDRPDSFRRASVGQQRTTAGSSRLTNAWRRSEEATGVVASPADVVVRMDDGSRARAARSLINAADAVARECAAQGPRFAGIRRLALVNSCIGMSRGYQSGRLRSPALRVIEERISAVDLILESDRLQRLVPPGDAKALSSAVENPR